MSLAEDSPAVNSSSRDYFAKPLDDTSSSDDFEEFLDAALDTASDGEDDNNLDFERFKRRKTELSRDVISPQSSSSLGEPTQISGSSPKKETCAHGLVFERKSPRGGGLCGHCGAKINDNKPRVTFGYMHKTMRLDNDEIDRLRDKDLKNLLRQRKLCLVLDLDHTLINSALISDITEEEGYLNCQRDALPDNLKNSLFRLDQIHMMTKLRPFVHTFLKEGSKLFEMYIYTMGERPYAVEMAKLLDPEDIYFTSRVIARGDSTEKNRKSLDVVLGKENAIVILDDTEEVWSKYEDNLILMERYHFFASSCKNSHFKYKSYSEQKKDEDETEGTLATTLKILQQIHSLFFDQGRQDSLEERDLRQALKTVRKEVLKGCKVVFSAEICHSIREMAEKLGAECCNEVDPRVTHVVSTDERADKSRWAVHAKKFLVHQSWIQASNYKWRKQPEENFPIRRPRKNEKIVDLQVTKER